MRIAGPLLPALGFLVQGLPQRQDTPVWLVLCWVPVLFIAGVLVNLGGRSMLDSARYMLLGFAIICAAGAVTARAADRASRSAPADRPGS